jgi:hypothetical protein
MIPRDKKHAENQKLASFVPKPKGSWFDPHPDPETMGLHQMQKNKLKKKKSR